MMIKDFIKEIKKTFGEGVEFKATSNDGQTYRRKGYDKLQDNIRRGVGERKKADW